MAAGKPTFKLIFRAVSNLLSKSAHRFGIAENGTFKGYTHGKNVSRGEMPRKGFIAKSGGRIRVYRGIAKTRIIPAPASF